MIASQVFLVLFDFHSHTQFTVAVLVFGFCSGPIFPSGMSWMDRYLRMSNLAYAFLSVGSSIGGFFFSWLAGQLFENKPVISIFYLSLSCCVAALAVLVAMQVVAARRGDRFRDVTQEQVSSDVETSHEPNCDDVTADTSRLLQRSLSSLT